MLQTPTTKLKSVVWWKLVVEVEELRLLSRDAVRQQSFSPPKATPAQSFDPCSGNSAWCRCDFNFILKLPSWLRLDNWNFNSWEDSVFSPRLKMSKAAKLTLFSTSAFAIATVVFVHYSQRAEKTVCLPYFPLLLLIIFLSFKFKFQRLQKLTLLGIGNARRRHSRYGATTNKERTTTGFRYATAARGGIQEIAECAWWWKRLRRSLFFWHIASWSIWRDCRIYCINKEGRGCITTKGQALGGAKEDEREYHITLHGAYTDAGARKIISALSLPRKL